MGANMIERQEEIFLQNIKDVQCLFFVCSLIFMFPNKYDFNIFGLYGEKSIYHKQKKQLEKEQRIYKHNLLLKIMENQQQQQQNYQYQQQQQEGEAGQGSSTAFSSMSSFNSEVLDG